MWISARTVFILALSFLNRNNVHGQGCLRVLNRDSDPGDPPFNDRNEDPLPSNTAVQAIVTSYQFYCDCVNITTWETYVQPGGRRHRITRSYDITFQLWRPSPTVNDTGCYKLVGENRFTDVNLSGGGLVSLSPTPPDQYLVANVGDVVGYMTNSRLGRNQGIQLEENRGYSVNTIWYHDFGADGILVYNPSDSECDISVGTGTDRSLRRKANAAPMLRISTTSARSCPVRSTSATLSTAEVSSMKLLPTFSDESITVFPSKTRKLQHSSISYVASEILSTMPSVPGKGDYNTNRSMTIKLAVIVTVVVVLCALILTVILIILILRKRKSSKGMKNGDALDLANPNYELASHTVQPKFQSSKKKWGARLQPKQLLDSNSATQKMNEEEVAFYDTIGNEESLDHKYPEEMATVPNDYDLPGDVYSTIDSSEHEPQKLSTADMPIYHIVGPHSGQVSSCSSSPVSETKDQYIYDEQNRFYHVLEEEIPVFDEKESSETRTVFASSGCHVPTQEERGKPSLPKGIDFKQTSKNTQYYRLKFFDESDIYWAPATTTTALYSQLAVKKYREVPRSQIRLDTALGSGQFGDVYKATWRIDKHKLELAVKTLKSRTSDEDCVKFLQEAAIMGQFNHRNVIKMHGVVTLGEPIYICLELLKKGDLQHFLLDLKLSGSCYEDFRDTHMMFLKFSKDIAAGMEYLSTKCFVHRDLAARNILLNEALTCKVADFGMARDLMDDTYYTSSGGKIPVKWTAPEALLYKKYSTDSDVWSYGMVLFEIWSVGKKPFSTLTNSQFLQSLQKGLCQPPPPGCPRAVYALMVDCWNPVHQCRPSFKQIFREYLRQPSSRLLFWAAEEGSTSLKAEILGGPIEESQELHKDLQNKYKPNN